ncbi:MAG: galactokinase [Nocardioidaceae bacterium]|nr:galactokinase [Nocardioidaceae bacterium]
MPETLTAWSPADGAEHARVVFTDTFRSDPTVVTAAPGRVNLVGEHTDYNAGLCLPIALPHATYAAASLRTDGRFRLVSGESPDGTWEGTAADLASAHGWAAYAGGAVWALGEAGHRIEGIDLAVSGCVPLGAGLSSSAALECSVGLAVASLLGLPDSADTRLLLARVGIRAENEVAGAATGGMDQTVAVEGTEGHALLLDCRDWTTEQVPFDPEADGLRLLVVDTRVHHALNDGGYASRRTDCEEAARQLGVTALREATAHDVDGLADDRIRRRARHVVTEIARVTATADALRAGDWAEVGSQMITSHASMRDDFEISCPELDLVVDTAVQHGAVGARMTGGGFGGSAIALVPAERYDEVGAAVGTAFAAAGHASPAFLPARASASARLLS